MSYRIEAISMTLSHLESHYYSQVHPPSVRPFITSQCTTRTAKCRMSETLPQDSQQTPVLWSKRSLRNSDGIILNGGAKLHLLTGREVFSSDLTANVCVHPPRSSTSMMVCWWRKK